MDANKRNKIDKLFDGTVTKKEMGEILFEIANDPQMEEYAVNKMRLNYSAELQADYGSFIPASSMAADDGENLCDFQCEHYILKALGADIEEKSLIKEAKTNYWLNDLGTPLYNMGKLMERNGLYVERSYDKNIDYLIESLNEYKVITVVNGNLLLENQGEQTLPDFCREEQPNHAVVVLGVSKDTGIVTLFNPATDKEDGYSEYDLDLFERAWKDSQNYMVRARKKTDPYEYNPQPTDVSEISINEELEQLIEMIASEVHDVWAVDKIAKNPGIKYAPLNEDGSEKDGLYNHHLLPYEMLTESDKSFDRKMVLHTIKLLKRLGYRLVNINNMYKCPECENGIEPDDNFCRCCGRRLGWREFR